MGTLALLFLVLRARLQALFVVLPFVVAVVAAVALQLAVFDVQDAGAEGVQEFAVVRDDDLCRRVSFEVVLQPDDGVEVEVVGGFVQEQQFGRGDEGAREVEPHPPAAGVAGNGAVLFAGREAEAIQQFGGAGGLGVAVAGGELFVRFGDGVAVAALFGCDDGSQRGLVGRVSGEDVVKRAVRQRRGFLGDAGDAPVGRQAVVAAVGVDFVAQQGEQG